MPRSVLLGLFFLLALAGCGPKRYVLPPLHPVGGKVVNGGRPVKAGSLAFHRVNEQNPLIVNGLIDEAGRFELASVEERHRHPGAPEGTYQVTYSPLVVNKDQLPFTLSKLVEIKEGPNDLLIDLANRE